MKAPLGFLLTLIIALAYPVCAQERKTQDRRITQVPTSSSSETKRVALVIGNSAYAIGPLKNPVNDARAMRDALLDLGFEVTYHENLTQKNMKLAIRAFGKKINGGAVGLFYFAGHGVQVNGQNFLIPVDSIPNSEDEVEFEAVRADEILAQMARAENGMNIVILDACRNNPFARNFRSTSEGLARMNAPTGTIIAYATAPGSVASDGAGTNNSIYTQALLRYMRMPGLSIEEVFKRVRIAVRETTQKKQTPWEESSLTGDFYFRETVKTVSSGELVSPSVTPPAVATSPANAPTSVAENLHPVPSILDQATSSNFSLNVPFPTATATIFFGAGRTLLSAQAKAELDQMAKVVLSSKDYVLEIWGYAARTGNDDATRRLSERRADAVVRYFIENHSIPMQRIINRGGLGALLTTITGRERGQSRGVVVNVLTKRNGL